jgi:hypothetical protein
MEYFGVTGPVPAMPGSDKVNWRANFDRLVSNLVLDVMKKMKETSKTGSTGFGQLSNKELSVLQNAASALKVTLKKEDAQRYLNQIKESAQRILNYQEAIEETPDDTNVDIDSKIQQARDLGYSDEEIQQYLNPKGQ